MPTVPMTPVGFYGLTSCCHTDPTFHGSTLCCRACGKAMTALKVEGGVGEILELAIMYQIDEKITVEQLLSIQNSIVKGDEPDCKPAGLVISVEEIEKAASTDV